MSGAPQHPTVFDVPGARPPASQSDWGWWTLGDLRDEFSRVIEMVSPSTSVRWVEVAPPCDAMPFTDVRLAVETSADADGIKRDIEDGAYLSTFDVEPGIPSWSCLVGGINLRVHIEEAC